MVSACTFFLVRLEVRTVHTRNSRTALCINDCHAVSPIPSAPVTTFLTTLVPMLHGANCHVMLCHAHLWHTLVTLHVMWFFTVVMCCVFSFLGLPSSGGESQSSTWPNDVCSVSGANNSCGFLSSLLETHGTYLGRECTVSPHILWQHWGHCVCCFLLSQVEASPSLLRAPILSSVY